MGQCVKSSRYLSMIPPVTIECAEVDGDCTTTPIFFEDRYVNRKGKFYRFRFRFSKMSFYHPVRCHFHCTYCIRPCTFCNQCVDDSREISHTHACYKFVLSWVLIMFIFRSCFALYTGCLTMWELFIFFL